MFCDRCGSRVEGAASFCPGCGRSFVGPVLPARNRVASHVRTLGILWLIRAGLRLMTGLFWTSIFGGGDWGWYGAPHFLPGLMRGVGFFFMAGAVAGAIAGWGLLDRRPWARMLAIVLGVLA